MKEKIVEVFMVLEKLGVDAEKSNADLEFIMYKAKNWIRGNSTIERIIAEEFEQDIKESSITGDAMPFDSIRFIKNDINRLVSVVRGKLERGEFQ